MRRRSLVVIVLLAVASATSAIAASAEENELSEGRAGSVNRPLATGVLDPFSKVGPGGDSAAEMRRTGAGFTRLLLSWASVAPAGATKPAGFDARNPGDPRYSWASLDDQIRRMAALRLMPIIYVQGAPAWAQSNVFRRPIDGPVRPSPEALADFATALASRYSGRFQGLPRVRYWQVWNEPNLSIFLMPQIEGGKTVSPDWYRDMVNAMARAVHAVNRDNVVIAGGLAPFGGVIRSGPDPDRYQERIAPLAFMRQMLCMSTGAKPKPTCAETAEFDVWSHHPYTNGGPTTEAEGRDDVSLGDLDEMRTLLEAARRAGHVKSRAQPGFWVTEFSYDSQPGDPGGLPPALHARWVSEALYRMWSDGVTLVTWFLLRDQPFPDSIFQSGLYTSSGNPKPALRAFRFPFVAFARPGAKVEYWGRTPAGVRRTVLVEQKVGARWRQVARLRTNRYGIFSGAVASTAKSGFLRARVAASDTSLPFSLTVPKNFKFCPFGSGC